MTNELCPRCDDMGVCQLQQALQNPRYRAEITARQNDLPVAERCRYLGSANEPVGAIELARPVFPEPKTQAVRQVTATHYGMHGQSPAGLLIDDEPNIIPETAPTPREPRTLKKTARRTHTPEDDEAKFNTHLVEAVKVKFTDPIFREILEGAFIMRGQYPLDMTTEERESWRNDKLYPFYDDCGLTGTGRVYITMEILKAERESGAKPRPQS